VLYPLIFGKDFIYLPKEHYCYVSFKNYRGILWVICNAYVIPLSFLSFIYFRITRFVHQQSNIQTFVIKRRQERDLIVIRRILINIGILLALGIPSIILLIMLMITGEEHPLIFRISLLPASLSIEALSITMILFTPLLKKIVLKKLEY
jgi:hypothetical protein